MDKDINNAIADLLKADMLIETRKYVPEIVKELGFGKWYELVSTQYEYKRVKAAFFNLDRVHGLVLAAYVLYTYHAIDKDQLKVLVLASLYTDIGYDGYLTMTDTIATASAMMLDSAYHGLVKDKDIKDSDELRDMVKKAKIVVRNVHRPTKSPSSLSKIMSDMDRMVFANKDVGKCADRFAGMYVDLYKGSMYEHTAFVDEMVLVVSGRMFNTRYGYLWGIRNNWPHLFKNTVAKAGSLLKTRAVLKDGTP